MNIRLEKEQDHKKVENMIRNAFWNLYIEGCEEHFLAHKMRKHEDFIPELSFVLEENQEIIGAIFFTKSQIITHCGKLIPTISFGPVAIDPRYHRQGYGRKLITHSINEAKNLGYTSIITLGYLHHYQPYGFIGAKKYHLSMSDGNFYAGTLALPLVDHALDNIEGTIHFSSVFDSITTEDIEKFDKDFAPKEKLILPSQEKYAKAVQELDTTIY